VHLICRPRTKDTVGDWGEVLRELPKRVAEWMQRLQGEHVRGADLVFACIGPALEIFSRFAKVETADGREVALAEYLEKVWEVVGRSALEQVLGAGTGALEEDARLTALFLWTLQSSNDVSAEASEDDEEESDDDEDEAPKKKKIGGYSLVFDVARRFAQPLGIRLPEWEGRIIEIEKGVVRLLPVAERAKQLFGEDGAHAAAAAFERNPAAAHQMVLFPDEQAIVPNVKGRGRKKAESELTTGTATSAPTRREATTLDRVHAAMLLQRGGQANALRALLSAEQVGGPEFLRLANALSALYPRESEEKRLLDAMLLAVPR
jgi:adenine-specific DNA methylase